MAGLDCGAALGDVGAVHECKAFARQAGARGEKTLGIRRALLNQPLEAPARIHFPVFSRIPTEKDPLAKLATRIRGSPARNPQLPLLRTITFGLTALVSTWKAPSCSTYRKKKLKIQKSRFISERGRLDRTCSREFTLLRLVSFQESDSKNLLVACSKYSTMFSSLLESYVSVTVTRS